MDSIYAKVLQKFREQANGLTEKYAFSRMHHRRADNNENTNIFFNKLEINK